MGSLLVRFFTEDVQTESTDQTDVYEDLSCHLYRVLDIAGVSEKLRDERREVTMLKEILITALDFVPRDGMTSWYIFGSKNEGTTTLGLHSDTDHLLCNERIPVVENINDAPVDRPAVIMLSDDTKPGYVKLQGVFNRTRMTINEWKVTYEEEADHQGRIFVKRAQTKRERHGPAHKFPGDECNGESDIVHAYRCRTIPSFANEWLHRPRTYQWPSQKQLKRMGTYGCFFVGVAHPESVNKEIEWRISFSLQERDLMYSLNPTQHKCYVLLKMIKKDIIQPRVGQSISSYHCKTCIFHLAESCGIEKWIPSNLVPCIIECLRLLLDWARQEKCPNYFVKEENMFDKLDKSTLIKLSTVLQELLSSDVQFLYDIKCDDLGMLLALSESDRRLKEKKLEVKQYYGFIHKFDMARHMIGDRIKIYYFINNAHTYLERASLANHILQYLEHTTIITEHTPGDVKMVLDRFIPYIHTVIVQMKCSSTLDQIKVQKDDDQIKWEKDNKVIRLLARDIQLCKHFDLISSRLIVALLYLHCYKLDSCQEILQNCETSLKPYVVSLCGCNSYKLYINDQLLEKCVTESLLFEKFRRECTAACMTFLPSEANLVPAALRYEMHRSVCTPSGSRGDRRYVWFDWIVVDSKVFLYFLQYLIYIKTNKLAYKQDAIYNLQHLVNNKYENLGHRETALNLLGWIYMQENRVKRAFDCFHRSLVIRPLHNAAKWHMAILIHSLITPQTIYIRK